MSAFPYIPDYIIESVLGEGGMATVYLGIQQKLNRRVAIKILDPSLLKHEYAAERFIIEAETAAKLSHSNIISIYDVGKVGKMHYMVMEYLDGSLKDLINSSPSRRIEPVEILNLLKKLGPALDYAHGEGIIHRDIKPDNIMFRRDGTPVLVDFGIARAVDSAHGMTKTGMSVGTPHYMSPEQCRAEPLDGRSDFYSLGVLLYETLIGSKPFDADTSMAVALKQLQDPVPELPENLTRYQPLLDKMLAKDKEVRIPNGFALVQLIDHILEEPEIKPAPSQPLPEVEPEPEPEHPQFESAAVKVTPEPETKTDLEPELEPPQPEAEVEPEIEPEPPRPEVEVELEHPQPEAPEAVVTPEPESEPPPEPESFQSAPVEVELQTDSEPVPEPVPVPVAAAEKKSSALTISIPNRVAVPVLIVIMAVIFVYFFYQGLKKTTPPADTPSKQTAELTAEKTTPDLETVRVTEDNIIVPPPTDTEDDASEAKTNTVVKPKTPTRGRSGKSRVKPVETPEAAAGRKPKALDDQAFREAANINTVAAYNAYLEEHPAGRHMDEAIFKITELKEAEQLRKKSRTVPKRSLFLRPVYKTLSYDDVESMIKKNRFYEGSYNETGKYTSPLEKKVTGGVAVIIDYKTRLMWHPNGSDKDVKFKSTRSWLKSLNSRKYGGYSDWRLPTLEEAASLLRRTKNRKGLYLDSLFPGAQKRIWTGDRFGSDKHWVVRFYSGIVYAYPDGNRHSIRPVRSMK
jgi:serine/threonine protein kinase